MKSINLFLMLIVVIASFAFAGGKQEIKGKEEKVTLVYWNRYSADPMKAGMQELKKDFEMKYPDIKIEENSTSDADYKTALPVVLASNDPPDFFYWYGGKALKQFVDNGLVYNLNDFYKKYGWKKELDANALKVVAYGGDYFAVPTEETETVLFINKSKFDEMGLGYPKHDEIISWNNFLNLCNKIKGLGTTPIVLGNGDQWCSQIWYSYVIANNIGVGKYNDIHIGKKPFNDQDVVASLEIISKDLLDNGYFNKDINGLDYFAALEPFLKSGAFMIHQVWMEQFIVLAMGDRKIQLDYILFPRINSNVSYAVERHIEGVQAMSAKTKHPEKSGLWLDFIISEQAAEKWVTIVPYSTPTLSARDKISKRNLDVMKSMEGHNSFWFPDHIINRAFVSDFYGEMGAFFGQIQDAKTTLNNLQNFSKKLNYVGALD
jgi:raffinose/stachyose/melibiose transport system substrate-binding protein